MLIVRQSIDLATYMAAPELVGVQYNTVPVLHHKTRWQPRRHWQNESQDLAQPCGIQVADHDRPYLA